MVAAAVTGACDASDPVSPVDETPTQIAIVAPELQEGGILAVGASVELQAELRDRRGRIINGRSVKWSSSDDAIARVDGKGNLTGVAPGTATIEASHRDISSTLSVTVVGDGGGDPGGGGGDPGGGGGDPGGGGGDPGGGGFAGTVNFFVSASSSFDTWTRSPTEEQKAFMREHYRRMLTFSPYFDSRLSWYPNAWVYKDAYAVYGSSELLTSHPDWVLHDAAGNMLYIPWGCSGGTCPQYAADFGNPEYRRWWIEQLATTLAEGYRGVWIDDVNLVWRVGDGNGSSVRPIDPRTGAEMTLDDWRRYFAEFMEEVRAAFPDKEIAHNAIWYSDSSDPNVRRQMAAADYINLERGATDRGIRGGGGTFGYETFLSYIDLVHSMGNAVVLEDDDSETDTEWVYELATYFLINAGDDMISADGDRSRMNPDNFWEGYLVDFGAALAGRYTTDGLFRRDYQCGTVVLNQPDQPTRTLDLGETYLVVGGGGTRVSSVTLDAYSAAVLLREGCTP